MDIFKLVGSIFVDTEQANKSISKTDKNAGGLGKTLSNGAAKAGKFAVGLAGAAAAGAAALMGVATKAAETADEIDKMSQKMGISREGYQEWSYVMGQNGMDISTLQTGMKTLVNQMESAANGSKAASANFEQLGISIYDSNGKLKDQETIMNEAIYALADMEDATMRSMMATNLFGKAGSEMMPMLNSGAEGMQELTQRAHDLGLIMSDDAVDAGVVFGDTLDDVKKSFGMVISEVGIKVMPIIQKLLDWVIENMPMIQEIFGEVFSFIEEVVVVAMDIIEDLAPVIEAVFKLIINLWNSSLKPVLLNIAEFIKNIFSGNFKEAFANLGQIILSSLDGLLVIFKKPLNGLISMINKVIGGINKIKVPDWVPGIGGKGVNIKEIPLLAKGGNIISAGQAIVGEAGPELLDLPVGAKVSPLSKNIGLSGTDALEQKVDVLISLIRQALESKVGVYINGDALVGQLLPGIDVGLGKLAARSGRGV